jgi:hypothetical protein
MDFELDPSEREIFDEINITQDEPVRRVAKPVPSRNFRKQSVSFDDNPDDDVDVFANTSKMNMPKPPPPTEWDGGEPDMFDSHQQQQQQSRSIPTGPSEGYKSIEDEKADLLNRIDRLGKKGLHTSNRLTVYSDIEDIRAEYKRLTYSIEVEQSVKFQRRMLVACVSGIEFLNKKFDPFDLELDGWSENVMESQEDYDTVFEELFQKYRTKVSVAPEIKLMFMIGGSAMMFHLSKSMFKPFTQNQKQAPPPQQTQKSDPFGAPGKRDMKGPGFDIGSLGGGIDIANILSTLQQQQNEPSTIQEEEMSDIISIGSEVRDFEIQSIGSEKKKRMRRPKKELVL